MKYFERDTRFTTRLSGIHFEEVDIAGDVGEGAGEAAQQPCTAKLGVGSIQIALGLVSPAHAAHDCRE